MDNLVKKLIYQSHYRSMKEADLLLSQFAKAKLHLLSAAQIKLYEQLLDYPDSIILNWISCEKSAPKELLEIIQIIQA